MSRSVESVAEVVNIGQEDINDEATVGGQVVISVFERGKLLLDLIKVSDRVKRQEDEVELTFMFKLIVTHIAFVKGDTLLYGFRLTFEFAAIGVEHLRCDIQSFELKVAGTVEEFKANASSAAGEFEDSLWGVAHDEFTPEGNILFGLALVFKVVVVDSFVIFSHIVRHTVLPRYNSFCY